MNDDPYSVVAAEQISNPVKARMRAVQTRAERRAEKQLSDKQVLSQQWQQYHAQRLKRLSTGKFRKPVAVLASFLESMTLEDGGALIELIERGPWREADADTRFLLLGLIARRIMYLREAEGLAPFDDSLPFSDEPLTVFQIIRERLTLHDAGASNTTGTTARGAGTGIGRAQTTARHRTADRLLRRKNGQ
jgi:hypothetical protein